MTDTEEYESIRRTLAAYNLAGDRMQIEGLAGTFLEDGVLETSVATYRGRQAIVDGLSGRGGPPATGRRATLVRHNLTTSLFDLTGPDTAQGRSYFVVFTDIGPDHTGVYTDKVRKVDGRWWFEHRRVLLDWMSDDTLFTGQVEAYRAYRAAKLAKG